MYRGGGNYSIQPRKKFRGGGNYAVPLLPRNTQMIANQEMFRRVQEMNEKSVMTEETLFEAYPPVSSNIMTGTLRRLMQSLMKKGIMTRPIVLPQLRDYLVTVLPQLNSKYDDAEMKKVLDRYRSILMKKDRSGYYISNITPEYIENLITTIETGKPIAPISSDLPSTQTGEDKEVKPVDEGEGEGEEVEKPVNEGEGEVEGVDEEVEKPVDEEPKGEDETKYETGSQMVDEAEPTKVIGFDEIMQLADNTRIFSILSYKSIKEVANKFKEGDNKTPEYFGIFTKFFNLRSALLESITGNIGRKDILKKIIYEAEKEGISINLDKENEFLNSEKMNGSALEYYDYLYTIDDILNDETDQMNESRDSDETDQLNVSSQSDETGVSGQSDQVNVSGQSDETGVSGQSEGTDNESQEIDDADMEKLEGESLFSFLKAGLGLDTERYDTLMQRLFESINTNINRREILEEIFEYASKAYDQTNLGIGQKEKYDFLENEKMEAPPREYYEYLLTINKIVITKSDESRPQTPGKKSPTKLKKPQIISRYKQFYERLQELTLFAKERPKHDLSILLNGKLKPAFDLLKEMIQENAKAHETAKDLKNYADGPQFMQHDTNFQDRKELLTLIVSPSLGKPKRTEKNPDPKGVIQRIYKENVEGS